VSGVVLAKAPSAQFRLSLLGSFNAAFCGKFFRLLHSTLARLSHERAAYLLTD
jgi:hypothetical protein